MSESAVQNLDIFQKICGHDDSDFAKRIRFVTTMWDEIEPGDGKRRLETLQNVWWAKMFKKGANHFALRQKDEPSIQAVSDITRALIQSISPVPLSADYVATESGCVQRDDIVILCVSFRFGIACNYLSEPYIHRVVGPDEIGKNAVSRFKSDQIVQQS